MRTCLLSLTVWQIPNNRSASYAGFGRRTVLAFDGKIWCRACRVLFINTIPSYFSIPMIARFTFQGTGYLAARYQWCQPDLCRTKHYWHVHRVHYRIVFRYRVISAHLRWCNLFGVARESDIFITYEKFQSYCLNSLGWAVQCCWKYVRRTFWIVFSESACDLKFDHRTWFVVGVPCGQSAVACIPLGFLNPGTQNLPMSCQYVCCLIGRNCWIKNTI